MFCALSGQSTVYCSFQGLDPLLQLFHSLSKLVRTSQLPIELQHTFADAPRLLHCLLYRILPHSAQLGVSTAIWKMAKSGIS